MTAIQDLARAKRTLLFYFKQSFGGLWDSDNTAEIEAAVDEIFDAAVQEAVDRIRKELASEPMPEPVFPEGCSNEWQDALEKNYPEMFAQALRLVGKEHSQAGNSLQICSAEHPTIGYCCSRVKGHTGQHIATIGNACVCAIWGSSLPEPEPDLEPVFPEGSSSKWQKKFEKKFPELHKKAMALVSTEHYLASPELFLCEETDSEGYHCSREHNHKGQHIATDGFGICAIWGASYEVKLPIGWGRAWRILFKEIEPELYRKAQELGDTDIEGDFCAGECPNVGYCCTREQGHSGKHIAVAADGTVLAVWDGPRAEQFNWGDK